MPQLYLSCSMVYLAQAKSCLMVKIQLFCCHSALRSINFPLNPAECNWEMHRYIQINYSSWTARICSAFYTSGYSCQKSCQHVQLPIELHHHFQVLEMLELEGLCLYFFLHPETMSDGERCKDMFGSKAEILLFQMMC